MNKVFVGITATLYDDLKVTANNITVTDADRNAAVNLGVSDSAIACAKMLDPGCFDVLEYLVNNCEGSRFEEQLEELIDLDIAGLEDYVAELIDEQEDAVVNIEGLTELVEKELLRDFEVSDFDGYVVDRMLYEVGPQGLGSLVASN